jgi:hypothetical protein
VVLLRSYVLVVVRGADARPGRAPDRRRTDQHERHLVNGWTLAFTLPSGQSITSGWNATYSSSSGQVSARNVSYNGTLPPVVTVDIGFQATHTGNTAEPAAFTLSGIHCTVV